VALPARRPFHHPLRGGSALAILGGVLKRIPTALWVAVACLGTLTLGLYAVLAPCYWAAQKKITRQRVEEIDKALLAYLTVEQRCPETLNDLLERRAIQRHALKDAWGTPIEYRCSDRGTRVFSAGRDKTFDTADDINSETLLRREARR
jgi:hypothetical protein